MFLLDTSTVSNIVSRRSQNAIEAYRRHRHERICISSVTAGEIRFGIAKKPEAARFNAVLGAFLDEVDVLAWTDATASVYGEIRWSLEKKGKPIGALDSLIAAQALEADAVLVTSDSDFRNVPGLKLADWTA